MTGKRITATSSVSKLKLKRNRWAKKISNVRLCELDWRFKWRNNETSWRRQKKTNCQVWWKITIFHLSSLSFTLNGVLEWMDALYLIEIYWSLRFKRREEDDWARIIDSSAHLLSFIHRILSEALKISWVIWRFFKLWKKKFESRETFQFSFSGMNLIWKLNKTKLSSSSHPKQLQMNLILISQLLNQRKRGIILILILRI